MDQAAIFRRLSQTSPLQPDCQCPTLSEIDCDLVCAEDSRCNRHSAPPKPHTSGRSHSHRNRSYIHRQAPSTRDRGLRIGSRGSNHNSLRDMNIDRERICTEHRSIQMGEFLRSCRSRKYQGWSYRCRSQAGIPGKVRMIAADPAVGSMMSQVEGDWACCGSIPPSRQTEKTRIDLPAEWWAVSERRRGR